MENMNIEVLLARMETHPEEFYLDQPKWRFIFEFEDALTQAEKVKIFNKLNQVRRIEFSQKVLQTLARENPREDNPYNTSPVAMPYGKKIRMHERPV